MFINLIDIPQIFICSVVGGFFGILLFTFSEQAKNQDKLKVSEAILVSFKKILYGLPSLLLWFSLFFAAQLCYYHFIYLPRL